MRLFRTVIGPLLAVAFFAPAYVSAAEAVANETSIAGKAVVQRHSHQQPSHQGVPSLAQLSSFVFSARSASFPVAPFPVQSTSSSPTMPGQRLLKDIRAALPPITSESSLSMTLDGRLDEASHLTVIRPDLQGYGSLYLESARVWGMDLVPVQHDGTFTRAVKEVGGRVSAAIMTRYVDDIPFASALNDRFTAIQTSVNRQMGRYSILYESHNGSGMKLGPVLNFNTSKVIGLRGSGNAGKVRIDFEAYREGAELRAQVKAFDGTRVYLGGYRAFSGSIKSGIVLMVEMSPDW